MLQQIKNSCPNSTAYWGKLYHAYSHPIALKSKPIEIIVHNSVKKPLVAIAMVILALATPILLLSDFTYTKFARRHRTVKLEGDCTNLFATDLLNHLQNEIRRIFRSSLGNYPNIEKMLHVPKRKNQFPELLIFYECITDSLPEDSIKARRVWFCKVMQALRGLVKVMAPIPDDSEIKCFMNAFIYAKYTEVKFLENLTQLIEKYPTRTAAKTLKEIYTVMLNDPDLQKDGDVAGLFDAQYFGNIPFALGTIQLNHECHVQMIRMPAATKDIKHNLITKEIKKVEVIEEFDFFLKSCSIANKKHFYVNLMLRHSGNQKKRTAVIEGLKHKYPDSFLVMSLDKDSAFYHQEGLFASESMNSAEFMEIFLKRLSDENGYYLLPDTLTKTINQKILESVHQENYHGKENLTRRERLNFIEYVYCKLIEKAAIDNHVTSMNISCLNCIDRGMTQCFNFLSYLKEKNRIKITEKKLNDLLLAPAVLVANRAPQIRFFERANSFREDLKNDRSFVEE